MPLFGLKLGLHEEALAESARELWRDGRFDFLELYVPRTASPDQAEHWRWYDGTLVLHAPHAMGGFNFARREMAAPNFQTLELLDAVRTTMRPLMLVFHPGLDGEAVETCRQVAEMRKAFPDLHRLALLENKPRLGLHGELCLGASPDELRMLLGDTGCGLCLDVRHAFAYAAWAGLSWRNVLDAFAALRPRLWHAADGDVADRVDSHLHIGDGNLPWREIGDWWRTDTLVTIECMKEPEKKMADFLDDVAVLRSATGSGGLTVRPATANDIELVWQLANDPVTRANSYRSDPIPFAAHKDWYARQLASTRSVILIGEDPAGNPVGYIRFTEMGDGTWETGISIDSRLRGRGLGAALTKLGMAFMFERRGASRLHAWIKSANAASLGMFAKAGFSPAGGEEPRHGILSQLMVATREAFERIWSVEL